MEKKSTNRPVRISQTWKATTFDFETRKWIFKPVFYVKQTVFDKSKRVGIKAGLELIENGYLRVTDDLREWLNENVYKHRPSD